MNVRFLGRYLWFGILFLLLFACSGGTDETPTASLPEVTTSPTLIADPTPSYTPEQPSPTPAPLAASVNGDGITLAEFQAELARYQAAVGRELVSDDEELVLNDLISITLLAQSADADGFQLEEGTLEDRMDRVISERGGREAFEKWMSANHYDQDSFQVSLARAIRAVWMRDKITAGVPEAVEQVHVRQILVLDVQEANEILQRLQAGADFTTLAAEYNPTTGGDLGWFPRGYALVPSVEEVAFTLDEGQYSEVFESDIGYHIILVLERDPERVLTPDARLVLQEIALHEWMASKWEQSDIQILTSSGE